MPPFPPYCRMLGKRQLETAVVVQGSVTRVKAVAHLLISAQERNTRIEGKLPSV